MADTRLYTVMVELGDGSEPHAVTKVGLKSAMDRARLPEKAARCTVTRQVDGVLIAEFRHGVQTHSWPYEPALSRHRRRVRR